MHDNDYFLLVGDYLSINNNDIIPSLYNGIYNYIELYTYKHNKDKFTVSLNFTEDNLHLGIIDIPYDLDWAEYSYKRNRGEKNFKFEYLIEYYKEVFNSEKYIISPIQFFRGLEFDNVYRKYKLYNLDRLNKTLNDILYFNEKDRRRNESRLKIEIMKGIKL